MSRADRLLERLLADGLPEGEDEELHELLRRDADARARYDRLRALCRVAAGKDPAEATDAELDRLGVLLEQRRVRATAATASMPTVRRRGVGRLWPAVAVAAAATLALVLWPRSVHHSGRITRGGAGAPTLCTVEAYAVPGGGAEGDADGGTAGAVTPRRLAPGDRVKLSEYLQFRYYSADAEVRWLYLFGLDARMHPLDYYPRPEATRSVPIEPGDPQSVGRSIRLEKRHQPGPLRVVGLCSRTPLERDAVIRAVQTLRAAGYGVRAVDHLPIEGVVAAAILELEVEP
jgi:hypothetical protein